MAVEKAKLAQADAAARATPTGDDDVKVGAAYLSYGDPAKAVEALKRGITKGKLGAKRDEAGILLGIAYLRINNKSEAAKAFRTREAGSDDDAHRQALAAQHLKLSATFR